MDSRIAIAEGITRDARDDAIALEEGTLVLPIRREQLFELLPRRLAIAEVGVARGAFSRQIKARARPSRLVLVDAWTHQAVGAYPADGNNVAEAKQRARFRRVRTFFKARYPLADVDVVREFSTLPRRPMRGRASTWSMSTPTMSTGRC